MVRYIVEYSFKHYLTKEKLYRVKATYQSGGVSYLVLNEKELSQLGIGE